MRLRGVVPVVVTLVVVVVCFALGDSLFAVLRRGTSDAESIVSAIPFFSRFGRFEPLCPDSKGQNMTRFCLQNSVRLCNSRGRDHCRWFPNDCGYRDAYAFNISNFQNRTFVFRGDSVLRELFSMFVWYYARAPVVEKRDANWTFRSLTRRYEPSADWDAYYKFDYEFRHLIEPLQLETSNKVDVAVVSVGMYNAKNYTNASKNTSIDYDIEDIPRTMVPLLVKGICDSLNASAGIVIGQTVECKAMRKTNSAAVKRNSKICKKTFENLRLINGWIETFLNNRSECETRKCPIYFIPPLHCFGNSGQFPCTADGVHARKGSNYLRTKTLMLAQSLDLVLKSL